MSSRLFSSLLLVISGVSCIKWWPLIQIIIRNVFVKLGPNLHNHHNHHKSDTRDCSRPPRPGNNKINWIQLIQVVVNQVDCKTFWRQDANNNWYEHKSNYWTFKLSFDWHQCSPSKEKNSFYNSTPIAHWGLVILIVLGLGGKRLQLRRGRFRNLHPGIFEPRIFYIGDWHCCIEEKIFIVRYMGLIGMLKHVRYKIEY